MPPHLNQQGFLTLSKRVELLPYQPRPLIPYEEMTDADIINSSGCLIFDSECYPNYYLAAFRHITTGKIIKLIPPFDARKLSYILHRYCCIGFNSIKYDLPLLWAAYKNQDTEWLKKVSNALVSDTWYQEVCKEYGITIFPTKNIDLIEVCPLRGSLKLYGARLHSKRIQELPYHHMQVLTEQEKLVVADYCINSDLPATELLFNNLKEQLELRHNISTEYRIDVMSKSDAQIAETFIGNEIKKKTGKWPSKPKDFENQFKYQLPNFISFRLPQTKSVLEKILAADFSVYETGALNKGTLDNLSVTIGSSVYRLGSGGLHSSENSTSCVSNDEYEIIDRDVESYYPRIVLVLGLFPSHLGPIFLDIYNFLVESRLADKKAKRYAQGENKKIFVNGTFGKTGSPYSILYAPQMMIQITVTGQLALLMLIEDLEINGIPIYSANTDGIVIYCPKAKKEQMNSIISDWEKRTGFTTEETRFKALYSRDVNAYLGIKEDGSIKAKNIYYDPWRPTNAKDAYWRFQKNPNAQICVEAIQNLITKGKPIEETIIECQDITRFVSVRNVKGGAHKDRHYLGKVIRYYWAKGVTGTIQYIESGNNVPDTEGAKPLMDLPDEMVTDVNHQWYIDKCREMLYEMGYLKRPEIVRFF